MRSGVYPGIDELKEYISGKNDIAFAFLFGSEAKGTAGKESDIDIGIYFYPQENRFDLEDDVFLMVRIRYGMILSALPAVKLILSFLTGPPPQYAHLHILKVFR